MSKGMWEDPIALEAYLKETVQEITGDDEKYNRRHVWNPEALEATQVFITEEFKNTGFKVSEMKFDAAFWKDDNQETQTKTVSNLIVEMKGHTNPDEIIIVGAHYDSRVGMSKQRSKRPKFGMNTTDTFFDTPGANDNGSGVAALLALAKAFQWRHQREPFKRTLRLVAWVNEEYPFFSNYWAEAKEKDGEIFYAKGMGSYEHAKLCRQKEENIIGVISLDTMGIYNDSEELNLDALDTLQKLLVPIIFPNRCDYVAFLCNFPSIPLALRLHKAYGSDAEVPSIVMPFPLQKAPSTSSQRSMPILSSGALDFLFTGWSDDWSYWQFDYPALIVTDTAYIRSTTYHSIHDKRDSIVFDRFAKVVWRLRDAIEVLVNAKS